MVNCHNMQFSSQHAQKRIERASSILGRRIVTLFIGLALYLLGAKITAIAMSLDVAEDTLKSFFQRFFKSGINAFEDRRRKPPPSLSTKKNEQSGMVSIKSDNNEVKIDFGSSDQRLKIPLQNKLQMKTILLTCLENKLLKSSQVSELIGYTPRHTQKLSNNLIKEDAYCLLDQRQGQKKDYLVTPEVKAEIIQQFVIDVICKDIPTGKRVSEALRERCEINISDRTVRYHISKLGLSPIRKSLPLLLEEFKKKLSLLRNELLEQSSYESPALITSRYVERRNIMFLGKAGVSVPVISWFIGRHTDTVRRWISPIENKHFADKKRSGRPPIFTQEMQLKTIGFYCQEKPLPGVSRWSLAWAEDYLNKNLEIIGRPISRSSIYRFLQSHALRPHKSRYFLNITDPDFFLKMAHILRIYANPPEYLFLFDECTGIQALSRCAPDSYKNEHSLNRESHYNRNGTTNLIAFMHHGTGQIFGRCMPTHDTEKFSQVFLEHVKSQPEDKPLHYIGDNYATHYSQNLCDMVADLCDVTCPKLKNGRERREWLQSEDKRIAIHFLPFHGSWLNMIEIWFGILKEKTLDQGWFENGQALITGIYDFIETWNDHYSHPFNWTYTGEDLQAITVRRFNCLLKIECEQMDCSFLKSQLLLMRNIGTSYKEQIPDEDWFSLINLINEKNDFIQNIIKNSTKPKVKKWTNEAFIQLKEFFKTA